jgi:hypothetical protein
MSLLFFASPNIVWLRSEAQISLFIGDVFGIRQDDSKLFSSIPGIALSPRRSVSANISAKTTTMKDMVAMFLNGQAANDNAKAYALAV